jgi:hypothetical protein
MWVMTSMAAGTFFWHAMNFLAPAAVVALLLGGTARLVHGPLLVPLGWAVGLNFVLGSLVLGLGLVLSGSDGRLATYAFLVLAMGSCQWLLTRTPGEAGATP